MQTFHLHFRVVLQTTGYLLNKVLLKFVDKTSYEIWNDKRPNLSYLKIWGCNGYMKRIVSEKLGAKSDNYKFVEYPKELVGYYLYHPIEQKMFILKYITLSMLSFAEEIPNIVDRL
jgi:hypothetical protein